MKILFINLRNLAGISRNYAALLESCDTVLHSINNTTYYEFCFHYHREQTHIDKMKNVLNTLRIALFLQLT